jgi:quercetin dioxygenase-like cupin family protein
MKLHQWNEIPKEQMNPQFARQVIHSDSMTVARVYLAKGCMVPEHSHPNEQLSIIESGKLVFRFGDVERIVGAGEVLQIPANLPHSAEALEDTAGIDLFSPCRQDWLSGNDAYLRSK